MKNVSCASVVESLMYAQICNRPRYCFCNSVLRRFSFNPRFEHWVLAKKVRDIYKEQRIFYACV